MENEELETPPAPGPFFRFTDEAAWLTAARDAGFMTTVTDEEGVESEVLQAYTHSHAIDVVGTITEGGEWDEDGNEIVAPTVLDGFHINYLGDMPDGWEAFEVTPENPHRVFA
jgi:hypothetical protein